MCIVCDFQEITNFIYKENCFNSLKSQNMSQNPKKKISFKEIISLIKVSMNLESSIPYVYSLEPKITLKH